MSKYYNKIAQNPNDPTSLVEAIIWFEKEIEIAQTEVELKGSIEKASSMLPGIMQHRFNQLQEIEAILRFLEIKMDQVKGDAFKKYLEHYNKMLSSRDAEKYAAADDKVIEIALLINQVALVRNEFLGIMKGLEAKHWQINNLVKLKTAGMEDYEISERW